MKKLITTLTLILAGSAAFAANPLIDNPRQIKAGVLEAAFRPTLNAIAVSTAGLRTDLTTETTTRIAADAALAVDTGTLTTGLATEISDRQIADAALAVDTGTLTAGLAAVAVDTGTITTTLAGKLDKTGGTMTGNIDFSKNGSAPIGLTMTQVGDWLVDLNGDASGTNGFGGFLTLRKYPSLVNSVYLGGTGSGTPKKNYILQDLGVGTNAPAYTLDVNGGIYSASSITANGDMYAAYYHGDGSLLTGIIPGFTNPATENLDMAGFDIHGVSSMTLTKAQINGDGNYVTIGGNARGSYANDLQSFRSNASQVASGYAAVLVGGSDNTASGGNSAVLGGYNNSAKSDYSVVMGYSSTVDTLATYAIIAGGDNNYIGDGLTSTYWASILGGGNHYAQGNYATIVGGTNSDATAELATIVGGNGNQNYSYDSIIAGGYGNYIYNYSSHSAILGGEENSIGDGGSAFPTHAVIVGGRSNYAGGNYSAVLGGRFSMANYDYATALGRSAISDAIGAFTWADSEGSNVTNNVQDRVWFKNRGGFMVTETTSDSNPALFVSSYGYTGFGTALPTEKVEVNGKIKATSFSMGYVTISSACISDTSCVATCGTGKALSGGCSTAGATALTDNYQSSDTDWTCGTSVNVAMTAKITCGLVE